MSIAELCDDLQKTDNLEELLRGVQLPLRNAFLYAAILVEPGHGNTALANKIKGALTCDGIPIGLQIVSWNVDSLRAGIVDSETASCKKKDRHILSESPMGQLISEHDPDVICLQETKIGPEHAECFSPEGYHTSWSSSTGRKGYSGVSVWSKEEPLRVDTTLPGISDELQKEGRILTLHFPGYILVNTYVPNTLRAGSKPAGGWGAVRDGGKHSREDREEAYTHYLGGRMEWDRAMFNYLDTLRKENPNVVWCGDMNVARSLIDIHNGVMTEKKLADAIASGSPQSRIKDLTARIKDANVMAVNGNQAGFRLEERAGIESILSNGFIDVYREAYPAEYGFTFWDRTKKGYRKAGNGWRIDYFIVSNHMDLCVRDIKVLKDLGIVGDKVPSDHAPLLLQF